MTCNPTSAQNTNEIIEWNCNAESTRDTIESMEWKWILEVREMHTKQLNESQSYSARSKNRMER